ncbi:hypothetical protein [Sphingomonas gilva]|uniref:hypothetical protein n=1 Tax=Sphingomonas gilva TaxID=2305907 RepID=UPI0011C39C38|nr:hypothetical protein [Sphingomonas gilva]
MADEILTPVELRRQAALREMDRFAERYETTDRNWREVDEGDRIALVGTTDDGRRFWVGYTKETDRERLDR